MCERACGFDTRLACWFSGGTSSPSCCLRVDQQRDPDGVVFVSSSVKDFHLLLPEGAACAARGNHVGDGGDGGILLML